MNKSESIKELATALSKAQSEMHGAKKDSTNPFFKSKYADLTACWEACREPLTKNGLSLVQSTKTTENGGTILVTSLLHSSGEWISGEFPVRPDKEGLQALGAALSYARRYTLSSLVGIVQEDDDGESAVNRAPTFTKAYTSPPTRPTTPAKTVLSNDQLFEQSKPSSIGSLPKR